MTSYKENLKKEIEECKEGDNDEWWCPRCEKHPDNPYFECQAINKAKLEGYEAVKKEFADRIEGILLKHSQIWYDYIKDNMEHIKESFGYDVSNFTEDYEELGEKIKELRQNHSYTGTPSESSNPSEMTSDVGVRDNSGETGTNISPDLCLNCGHEKMEHRTYGNMCNIDDCMCVKFKPRESKDKKAVNDS